MKISKFVPLALLLALLSALVMVVLRPSMGSPIRNMGMSGWSKPSTPGATFPDMGMNQDKMMYYEGSQPGIMPVPEYYPYGYPGDALNVPDRAVERYSSHAVLVNNVSEYLRSTREYMTSIGGTILSYSQGSSDGYDSGSLTVKIPNAKFDEATAQVTKNVKKVLNENVSAYDITGQVSDVRSQIQNWKDQIELQEIFLLEATTQVEKRRIQMEIDRLNRELQQFEQNQKNLEERTTYATVSISAVNKEYAFNGRMPRLLGVTLREAWESLQGTGYGLVSFLIWVVVYAIIWIPVLLIARWIWMKVRANRSMTTSKK